MDLFSCAFYFLFCLSWTFSSNIISTPIRKELFDSSEKSRFLWTGSPATAWEETEMQLGKSHAHPVYHACNRRFKNKSKTLLTKWIPKQDAHELLLDLSFAQADQQPLYIFVIKSNQSQNLNGPQRPVLAITVQHPFPADDDPRDEDLSHAKGLYLGNTSQNDFYLVFSYSGNCMFIASIQVFFLKCPAFALKQMEFEETAAGQSRRGVCVDGAVEISTPLTDCQSNGTWAPPQGSCVCGAGYQTNGDTCKEQAPVNLFATPHSITDPRPALTPVHTGVVVAGVLLLLISTAVVLLFVRHHKLRGGQGMELVSGSAVTQYQRQQVYTAQPEALDSKTSSVSHAKVCRVIVQNQSAECKPCFPTAQIEEVSQRDCAYEHKRPHTLQLKSTNSDQMLDGMKDRLLCLREVLVERTKLKINRKLGKGEFGAVYEGIFSPKIGQDIRVAVKTSKDVIPSEEDLESFLKEAEMMKDFDHVNVVKLLGVALEWDPESSMVVPLVILPYMKHRDLHSFLKATRYDDVPMFVPHQSLLRFMMDIAAGMEYLSLQGFLHRDLAARNCMLGDDLRVCVADFGLSKMMYSCNYYRHKSQNVKLPVRWMAIESMSDFIFTTKSDVWSFGVTMWEITSRGKVPYPGLSNYELLDYLEKGHRLGQGDNDSNLYEVMLSCWHRDPFERPSFGELHQSLSALLSELPPLEARMESHYINLGLEAANNRQDSGKNQVENERDYLHLLKTGDGFEGEGRKDEEGEEKFM
ncbi:tyrosine-protein kinase receptor TYRO3 [Danio aesculapii]|uniref:tyrosine-protein kinase receptor TYRO3 n=1 Tax=Danio aesculapii TaxID=1142201 RepID=UPI0024BF8FD2|nr:tyrosine-protein kinase receptor TYRO3 [Danio aesculapii]